MRTNMKHVQRKAMILKAGIAICRKPGGWGMLTRARLAKRCKCSDALISVTIGNMDEVRKAIITEASELQITEILVQSIYANDGYVKTKR